MSLTTASSESASEVSPYVIVAGNDEEYTGWSLLGCINEGYPGHAKISCNVLSEALFTWQCACLFPSSRPSIISIRGFASQSDRIEIPQIQFFILPETQSRGRLFMKSVQDLLRQPPHIVETDYRFIIGHLVNSLSTLVHYCHIGLPICKEFCRRCSLILDIFSDICSFRNKL